MLAPTRVAAGWLGGRLLLYVLIVVLLAAGPSRSAVSQFAADLRAMLPDRESIERLRKVLDDCIAFERSARTAAERRVSDFSGGLKAADGQARSSIIVRRTRVAADVAELERRRLSPVSKVGALLTGRGVGDDLRNEISIAIGKQEIEALDRLLAFVNGHLDQGADLEARTSAAWAATRRAYDAYLVAHRQYESLKTTILFPVEWTEQGRALRKRRDDLHRIYDDTYSEYRRLHVLAVQVAKLPIYVPLPLRDVTDATVGALRDSVAIRAQALAGSERFVNRCRRVLWQAFAIVVAVTLSPIFVRAFWYWLMAPWVVRRPPVRIDVLSGPKHARTDEREPRSGRISGVAQAVVLRTGDELIVHPEFLQSAAAAGRKRTQWLLNWRFPLSSLASRMVALTSIRDAAGETFVISSTTDPLSEIGLIAVEEGRHFVLQPRYLVGIVQQVDSPARMRRHWRFGLSAWVTLQFRYLTFEGPCTLIVQGCRGIRLEPADGRRAIDQNATIGFDAHLAYSPRRTETFVPYLFGMRGLFNDGFQGAGVFAYEEMPYAGKRAGITGRGLEGLTDGIMKVFGI